MQLTRGRIGIMFISTILEPKESDRSADQMSQLYVPEIQQPG